MKKISLEIFIQDVDAPYLSYDIDKIIRDAYYPFHYTNDIMIVNAEQADAIRRDHVKPIQG